MKLSERMRQYEDNFDYTLTARLPILMRLDGRGFSRFTKFDHCHKPFDDRLSDAIVASMLAAAGLIEDCVFGFTQSDEITLVLRNDHSLDSMPWFSNRLQKMCSIAASCVTANFNLKYGENRIDYVPALFDCRIFAVPNLEEAANNLIYRQRDCVKNSISTACYHELSQKLGKKKATKLLQDRNSKQRQELLFQETGINWSTYPAKYKNGVACYKEVVEVNGAQRSKWKTDDDLPMFAENYEWLLKHLDFINAGEDV